MESNSSSCFNILFHNVRLSNVKNSNHLYVWCKSNTVKRFHAFTKKRHIKPYHFQIHLSFFNRYKALEKMKIHRIRFVYQNKGPLCKHELVFLLFLIVIAKRAKLLHMKVTNGAVYHVLLLL